MLHIYHPNKAVKGFACSFWRSSRDNSLFATLVKQAGWDSNTQTGTFKGSMEDPTKHVNVKLSEIEACAILDCIERNRPFTTFHQSDDAPKSITFVPWMSQPVGEDDGDKPPQVQQGFSFAISVKHPTDPTNKNSFYIGLTYPEARWIREFLIDYLHQGFHKRSRKDTPAQQESQPIVNTPTPEQSKSLVDL